MHTDHTETNKPATILFMLLLSQIHGMKLSESAGSPKIRKNDLNLVLLI